ncbi:hypothetical protein BC831DRAFT_479327 [Entophlyctis helioformis]|nr:hypothetical protein BC831DRAFT_479327 [Entophlyctis helioformis]
MDDIDLYGDDIGSLAPVIPTGATGASSVAGAGMAGSASGPASAAVAANASNETAPAASSVFQEVVPEPSNGATAANGASGQAAASEAAVSSTPLHGGTFTLSEPAPTNDPSGTMPQTAGSSTSTLVQITGGNENSCGIFVENLSWWTSDEDMIEIVRSAGTLHDLDMNELGFSEHRNSGKSKGLCFLLFKTAGSAATALEFVQRIAIHGTKPKVSFAPPNLLSNPFLHGNTSTNSGYGMRQSKGNVAMDALAPSASGIIDGGAGAGTVPPAGSNAAAAGAGGAGTGAGTGPGGPTGGGRQWAGNGVGGFRQPHMHGDGRQPFFRPQGAGRPGRVHPGMGMGTGMGVGMGMNMGMNVGMNVGMGMGINPYYNPMMAGGHAAGGFPHPHGQMPPGGMPPPFVQAQVQAQLQAQSQAAGGGHMGQGLVGGGHDKQQQQQQSMGSGRSGNDDESPKRLRDDQGRDETRRRDDSRDNDKRRDERRREDSRDDGRRRDDRRKDEPRNDQQRGSTDDRDDRRGDRDRRGSRSRDDRASAHPSKSTEWGTEFPVVATHSVAQLWQPEDFGIDVAKRSRDDDSPKAAPPADSKPPSDAAGRGDSSSTDLRSMLSRKRAPDRAPSPESRNTRLRSGDEQPRQDEGRQRDRDRSHDERRSSDRDRRRSRDRDDRRGSDRGSDVGRVRERGRSGSPPRSRSPGRAREHGGSRSSRHHDRASDNGRASPLSGSPWDGHRDRSERSERSDRGSDRGGDRSSGSRHDRGRDVAPPLRASTVGENGRGRDSGDSGQASSSSRHPGSSGSGRHGRDPPTKISTSRPATNYDERIPSPEERQPLSLDSPLTKKDDGW